VKAWNIKSMKVTLFILIVFFFVVLLIRGCADKSLARPTSRCCRIESIVSLERGVCTCADLKVFSCYRD